MPAASLNSLVVVFTDGAKEVKIATSNYKIERNLLEALFKQHIVGLECIEKTSNVLLFT